MTGVMIDDPLPHLATFARAAELGSFTAAARALRLTQAAVSQRIRALEQSLDVALFHRGGGRVALTDAGRKLHAYAQDIQHMQQQARQAVTGQRAPVLGELAIAASSVPGEHLLPTILAAFGRKYPQVHVKVTVADSAAVLRDLVQGKADVGLVGKKEDSPHLEFCSIACDQLVLVVNAQHPLRRRRRIRLRELASLPLILRERGSGSRWCVEQALAGVGQSLRDLHITLELGSNEGIKQAVAAGAGVALLSARAVQADCQAGQLHALHVADLPLKRAIFIVRDQRRALSIPARLFWQALEPAGKTDRRP